MSTTSVTFPTGRPPETLPTAVRERVAALKAAGVDRAELVIVPAAMGHDLLLRAAPADDPGATPASDPDADAGRAPGAQAVDEAGARWDDGCACIALWPDAVPDGLTLDGGLPADELHITLAMVDDLTPGDLRAIVSAVSDAASTRDGALAGTVTGSGRFMPDGEEHPVWASLDVPGLAALRQNVVQRLGWAGATVRTEHDFAPHMTLAYVDPDAPTPQVPPGAPITFSGITIARGTLRLAVTFPGVITATVAELESAGSVAGDAGDVERDAPTATDGHVDSVTSTERRSATYVPTQKSMPRRFTLGPWYIPDVTDAHGEGTDPDTLQAALWDYVRAGNRTIYLQHDDTVPAGEWVEAVTWPYPVSVPMLQADGTAVDVELPAGTVFLGVIWLPWAWELVLTGKITGLSIGGTALRVPMP